MKKSTIFITGSSRGIGKAIAIAFAATRNYHVILNCRKSLAELEETAAYIHAEYGISCDFILGDVGNPTDVKAMFEQIHQKYNGLDVLINNAGISHIGLITDLSVEQWQTLIQTNLSSVFYCCKEAIPYMVSQKNGKIINISSMWGSVGASCEVAYSAAKAGVHGLTKSLAKELAPSNIQVNAIACGVIDTQMNNSLTPEDILSLTQDIPAGRFGTPSEIAQVTYTLASAPSYLTGQIIGVDGGFI